MQAKIPVKFSFGGSRHENEGFTYLQTVRSDSGKIGSRSRCSSHQLRQEGRRFHEPDNALSLVSRQDARIAQKPKDLANEVVEAVEYGGCADTTYNLEVEGTNNYFADGVLVHNCVDDAHNAQEASSDADRQNVIDWWTNTMSTRGITRGVRRVVIMQRLHDDDLSGQIIKEMTKGDKWDHLCLPMEFEPDHPHKVRSSLGFADPRKQAGELLWPALFPRSVVASLKIKLGSYATSGQLQQRPSPAGGGKFKREWFSFYDDAGDWYVLHGRQGDKRVMKKDVTKFIACDTAMTEKKTADYSVLQVWGVTPKRDMILIDSWRGQVEVPELESMMKSMAHQHKPSYIGVEATQPGKITIQRMIRAGFPMREYQPVADKVARSQTISVMCENGRVFFPADAPWYGEYERELLVFPNGKNDDQCLTSNTLVFTMFGWKQIIQIKAGEWVWTRAGLRQVLWSGQTGLACTITRLGISGTPGHRVWTENRGWVQLQFVKPSDVLVFADSQSTLMAAREVGFVLKNASASPQCKDSEYGVPVYNLSVEGAHEFFANGILVHNCDATAYAGQDVNELGDDDGVAMVVDIDE